MAVVVSFVGKWDGKDVKRAQREIDKFSGQSKKSLGGFAKRAGVALGAVSAAAGVAAVGVGVAAGRMAVNFDTAMTKIQSLVGLTASEVDKMKGSVLELSGQTAKSPEELADGLFVVTSAGLRGAEAMSALEFAAKAGAAGLGETNDIARSVAGAISAYGSDVIDAATATDQIVATARAGNFETSQFAGALGRVLPFANQAGAGLDQVGGAVALLTRVNGDAAQSVTQMNALFKAFVTPTEEAKKVLGEVGMSAGDVRDAIARDGLPAALDMLEEKLGGNREQLGKMLGSSEAASAAFQILDADSQTIADTFGVVADSAGMTEEAFGTTADTAGFKLQEAFQEIKNSLLELGEAFLPLIELFAERIGVVTEIIEKLSPVIEPLVGVLMEVGEILADILLDALDALIPAITPLIEIFGDLVRRIGPLLAKIIGKVAEVLAKLLEVVVPLLEPLIDLVFGILEAAWPIIETVVDVLLTLVDALTPLLDAVMMLLTPLGDLIETGLKALMPVIEPLLPVIEALAAVFADVLVRAIGLVMTSIGMMIQAWSKLAPFVIDKVLAPILDRFLEWAEGIVAGAETAFGWVPGLGSKLGEAKDAIATFRDDSAAALATVSETIAEEGERIGKDLVDQGVMAMTNPDALRRTRDAGKRAGKSMSDGMRIGIQNGQIPVEAATKDLVFTADQAARAAAEARSPSELFARLGDDLVGGIIKGLERQKPNLSEKARQTMVETVTNRGRELLDNLKSIAEESKQFGRDVASNLMSEFNIATAFDIAKETGRSIVDIYVEQGERAKEFGRKLQELARLGLNRSTWQSIASESAERGIEIADAFLDGNTREMIDRVNEATDSAQFVADEVGNTAAAAFYDAGIAAAVSLVSAFIDEFGIKGKQRRRLNTIMDNLVGSLNRDVSINVRTPSGTISAGGGGGGGGGPATPTGGPAVTAGPQGQGAAASASIAAQFSQEVLNNAARLNAAAAAGQDVTQLGFNAADWDALAALEAANIAALASGGIVTAPTLALIGEAGPEAVVPLSGRHGMGNTYNVTVNAGIGTDGAEVGRQVIDAIKAYERRNGRVYASA